MKIYKNDAGHMTKMDATPIYVINALKIFFLGTSGPILIKHSMTHLRLKLIILCLYDNMLILTYFSARSNFAT